MSYETRTCADCGRREPMDLPREVRFAGEYGPLCDDCLPLALRVAEANAANATPDPALLALALRLLANWAVAVDEDADWDGWDDWWRDAMYGAGPLREPLDREIVAIRAEHEAWDAETTARLLAPDGADRAGEVTDG